MIHSLSSKSMLFRTSIERLSKTTVYLSSVKWMSSSTSHNVIKSSYPDVEISKSTLSNYLLENIKEHTDKPAVVSMIKSVCLYLFLLQICLFSSLSVCVVETWIRTSFCRICNLIFFFIYLLFYHFAHRYLCTLTHCTWWMCGCSDFVNVSKFNSNEIVWMLMELK